MGPRAGLEGCGKSRPHRDSIAGPSESLYRLFLVAQIDKGYIFVEGVSRTEICMAVLPAVCNRTLDVAGSG